MTYTVHKTTNPYLQRVRAHRKPYSTEVLGKDVLVYPQVMSPKYDWSSRFYINSMPNQKGKDFLEVGCGSGVISLFAAFQQAQRVVSVDINPNAVENTKANFQKHGFTYPEVFESNVFDNVSGHFNTILFNAPYHGNQPKDILEYGVSDPNYQALRKFLTEATSYLKPGGQIILGFSDTGDLDLLNTLLIENQLKVTDFRDEQHNEWMAYMYTLEPIHFSTPRQHAFYNSDYFWFKKYKKQILSGKVLKVGYGLGYASYFIRLFNKDVTSLDVALNPGSLDAGKVVLYGGEKFPFADHEFDIVICTYTLHHTHSPERIFSEMYRVSKSKIIVIEETHTNLLEKLQHIYSCWYANRDAHQSVGIRWNSYMSSARLANLFRKFDLKITRHDSSPNRSYKVELVVGQKNNA